MRSERLGVMYRRRPALAALAAALLTLGAGASRAGDAAHGMQVFRFCSACHSGRPDALGPDLKGVVGRQSASVEGFRYSGPMRRSKIVWDEANLKQYITDPQGKVPGNRMPFDGLHDPRDVDDLIAYLKTLN